MAGIKDAIKLFEMPSKDAMIGAYKDLKTGIRNIEYNSIMVNFYEKNSPFYQEVKGTIYHIGMASLVRIESPHKLGWILMDDSIEINKITKESRVICRQDYPLTLSTNRQLANALVEAISLFPDTEAWYIPSSIRNIPVKQMIIKRSKSADKTVKDALMQVEGTKNLVQMIDAMPSDLHVTTQLLYDLPDMKLAEALNEQKPKGNFIFGIFMAMAGSFITLLMVLYLKI